MDLPVDSRTQQPILLAGIQSQHPTAQVVLVRSIFRERVASVDGRLQEILVNMQ